VTLPNYIVLGVGKAATTSVYNYSAQHPDIYMSPVKETNYFILYDGAGEFSGPYSDWMVNRLSVGTRTEYEALFAPGVHHQVRGEASPKYMTYPEVPGRIAAAIPACRLVIGLRQPADRAFAAWAWSRTNGRESLPFEEAFAASAARRQEGWAWGDIEGRSHYADQLERVYRHFPREQVYVYLFEEFAADPVGSMRAIYGFLGVDATFTPDTSVRHYRSGLLPNRTLQRLWEVTTPLRYRLAPLVPQSLRSRANQWVTSRVRAVEFDPELRRRMTERFRQDIERTAAIIDRDLHHWLEPGDEGVSSHEPAG
jgi:hypothetical protein